MSQENQKKELFNEDHIIIRNSDDFMYTEVDGESVLMNIKSGMYLGLNNVTTDIWNYLEKAMSYNDLITQLIEEYEIDEITCRQDTMPIILGMLNGQLIKIKKD